jgi:PGF-CTERM protein
MTEETNNRIRTTLDDLRTKYENEVPPSELNPTAVRLQVLYKGGAGTDDAVIDDETEAIRYMRNAEEVKGHLESSIRLKSQEDPDGASLHAGHPTDYMLSLGPAAYAANPDVYERLSEVAYGTGDRVDEESLDEYESYVRDEVFPAVDASVDAAVPDEYHTTETQAQVAAALTGRLMEEYTAAVTEEGEVELEGEYWDGRGFLVRITETHESSLGEELSEDTTEDISGALDGLRSSYEETVPPSELEPAVEETRTVLTSAEYGETQTGSSDGETGNDGGAENEMDDSETDTESDSDGNTDTGSESGGQGMPGFTALAALVALLCAAYLRE